MVKTIKVDEKVHKLVREYKEKRGLSSFGEAIGTALHEAEGIMDDTGLIVSTRDVLGGQPRIRGTRIGVLNVHRWHFEEGMNVEEICEHYYVEPEGVEAAIRYIENRREEIDQLKREYEIAERASQERARELVRETLDEDLSR